ncbi:MAG: sugar transferase, partial [Actinomycetota bacterium]|nr:sugar transferase [Actinomycetota bacterium]
MVDVGVATFGLVLLSPLFAAVAVAVRVRLGSPVLFRQRRSGRNGRPFELLKFRSMRAPAPGREAPEFDHERIDGFGRLLRGASLDELPS